MQRFIRSFWVKSGFVGLVLLVVGASVLYADAPSVSARVVGLNMPSTFYKVSRASGSADVYYYAALYDGDLVSSLDQRAVLKIRFSDQSVSRVTFQSPLRIVSRGRETGVLDNVLEAFWAMVTRAEDTGLRSTVNRGGDDEGHLRLMIPGLDRGSATIRAGQRNFMIEWRGGVSPFRVQLIDASGHRLVDEGNVLSHRLAIGSRRSTFSSGRYSIAISDSAGRLVAGSFAVDGSLQMRAPALPNSLASSYDQQTMFSAELVRQDQSRFSYEAYLLLFEPARADWAPAVELRHWIGSGAAQAMPR